MLHFELFKINLFLIKLIILLLKSNLIRIQNTLQLQSHVQHFTSTEVKTLNIQLVNTSLVIKILSRTLLLSPKYTKSERIYNYNESKTPVFLFIWQIVVVDLSLSMTLILFYALSLILLFPKWYANEVRAKERRRKEGSCDQRKTKLAWNFPKKRRGRDNWQILEQKEEEEEEQG